MITQTVETYGDFIDVATHEFVINANEGYRYGQALFNVLLTHRPNLAARVRGSRIDPFEEDAITLNGVIGDFLVFVQENW